MKKTDLSLAVILFCGLAFIGCGKNQEAERKPEEEIILTVLDGQSTSDAGIEDMINEVVSEKFPNVKLEWECVDWGTQFDSQMQARFAAGDIPDIMIGKAQDVGNYCKSGNLASLSSRLTERIEREVIEFVTVDGEVYGLPYNAWYQGVLYNKKIFEVCNLKIPATLEEMKNIIEVLEENQITPFAGHFQESWNVGNMTMQLMMNDIFRYQEDWGEQFRRGETGFYGNPKLEKCFLQNQLIKESTWEDAMTLSQYECDSRFEAGDAAMYLTGLWSLQFANQYNAEGEFGIFPYPNQTGDACLIKETNLTFMKSADSQYEELIDDILYELITNEKLITDILEFTQTYSVIKGISTPGKSQVQQDIDRYEEEEKIIDVTGGNRQLIWIYQNEVAQKQLEWLKGNITLEEVLLYADSHREESGHEEGS